MLKWIIDQDHTVAAFFIRHMMVSNVHGQFNNLSGVIHFDPSDLSATTMEIEMKVSSIWTGIEKRDRHLKSSDFFDMEQHPLILFKGAACEPTGSNRFRTAGDLTIHGTTNPVILDTEYFGPVEYVDEEGKYTTLGFHARTTVNREDFGLRWNVEFANNSLMVGRYVQIVINAEADLEKE